MVKNLYTVITKTASYIPTEIITNENFLNSVFYDSKGNIIEKSNEEIIQKFYNITGILERRRVTDDLVTSDIGGFVAKDCYFIDDEKNLKYLIFAHNFGDVKADNKKSDFVPSLAARVKNKLKIKNPWIVAYDLPFGCPGWLEGVIHADDRLKKGEKAIVIGAETLSRISDPHDIDSMIYADGAGANLLEKVESEEPVGILSHASRSDALDYAYMLRMDKSYNPHYKGNELFLKMDGHSLYEYALKNVPGVVKKVLDKARLSLKDVKKILIHQANEKMDEAIVRRLFKLYGEKPSKQEIQNIMPMVIPWLGNSSVATLPTLLDLINWNKDSKTPMPEIMKRNNFIVPPPRDLGFSQGSEKESGVVNIREDIVNARKNEFRNHKIERGDVVVFASVGAGMNINSVIYKFP
ncbi:MAG: ketoacyl-ACP synthase III [archaeon]